MSYYCACGQRMKCVKTGARVVDDGGSIHAADVFECTHGSVIADVNRLYVVNDREITYMVGYFGDNKLNEQPFFLEIHG